MEKLERYYYIGMWLIGKEVAKFAVSSGLADSEEEFFEEEFKTLDCNLHSKEWKANSNFQGVDRIDPYLNGASFYTLDGIYQEETSCSFAKSEDLVFLIDAKRQPMPFEAAYANEGELIEEFRTRFGKFLPEDFDYKSHIGIYQVSNLDY